MNNVSTDNAHHMMKQASKEKEPYMNNKSKSN